MITTLIPAYKPQFIGELLLGLANQTFKNFKVIISDDSPNNEVSAFINSPNLAQIRSLINLELIEGPKKGGYQNTFGLLRRHSQNSEFFHVLFDDDVIYPTFYETHLRHHSTQNSLVSVSARWIANPMGMPYQHPMDYETGKKLEQNFDAKTICQQMLPAFHNKLGEYSHALYRKEASPLLLNPSIDELSYFGLDDLGSFINSTKETKGIYIANALGFFRTHPQQNTNNTQNTSIKSAHLAWIAMAVIAHNRGWLDNNQFGQSVMRVKKALLKVYKNNEEISPFLNIFETEKELASLKRKFTQLWSEFLLSNQVSEFVAGNTDIKLL